MRGMNTRRYCSQIEMAVDQEQPFLLRSCNSVTLLSSRDAFRQRKKDYQSIFIPVLQIYITAQAIRKRVEMAHAAKGLMFFYNITLYDRTVLA